jgi:hypothetical protein
MDFVNNLALGFSSRYPHNIMYCFIGVLLGTSDRRAARHRPDRDDLHVAAGHVRAAAGVGADHAGGHLLRRAVRRLHHGHPGQPAG